MLKIYAWYDNEWGYANRYAELARKLAEVALGANWYRVSRRRATGRPTARGARQKSEGNRDHE
jgi:hypothetical protein